MYVKRCRENYSILNKIGPNLHFFVSKITHIVSPVFALLLTNLLFLFYFLSSRTFKDMPEVLDYEEESKTYLAKTS